ncbi:MAG TPA: hypothetical protein VIU15_33190 [Streptomyces sp.]
MVTRAGAAGREHAGRLWRRRVRSERELPEWMVWPAGSSGMSPSAGVFWMYDTVYALEWLPAGQAEAAQREFGWDSV